MGYADEMFDLTDRVVLITGGSRGLGREMAFAAARCGADVVVASRKLENCVATAEQITAQTGRAAFPYQVHVGRWEQLDGLVQASYDRFGKIDVLVNNAGMSPVYEKQTDVTEKMFDAVVSLNFERPCSVPALVPRNSIPGCAFRPITTRNTISRADGGVPYGVTMSNAGSGRSSTPSSDCNAC